MISDRVKSINPFIVMDILDKAQEMERNGCQIIHFEIGEPDFNTPNPVIEGCFKAMQDGKTHYTHSLGILELRESLSKYKLQTRGTLFDAKKNFMVTGGTSPAFFIIFSTLINPGDEVILTDPGYPCYVNFINFFGGKPIFVPIYEEDKFDLRIDLLKKAITNKTRMIILNSPSNPTGQIIKHETLNEIADIIKDNKIWVISDEIYAELTYDSKIAPSLSQNEFKKCHDHVIVIDGFSKFWAMTGFRLGYIIAPEELIKVMTPVQQNFLICPPSISQYAGLYALECTNETQEMLRIYKERRDYIVQRINNIPNLSCIEPKGAFYAFCNIKKLGIRSYELSKILLEKAHIAVTPGIAFGSNAEGYIRFSYPTDIKNIKIGLDRLESYLRSK